LSGGQAQRVALARTLAAGPRALVLDEPLAALDARARADVQRALADHLASFDGPSVLVTHDVVDALVLADRLAVLEDGRIVQNGAPRDVVRRPATPYVAHLLGLNLFRAPVPFLAGGGPAGANVAVRPSAITLEPAGGEARTGTWVGTVAAVSTRGEHVRVEVDGEPGALVETTAADLPPYVRPGARVAMRVAPAAVETY
ncbi:TOBE domain-containing protein, partial [Actinotalea ferrariae]|uniref:TOBE domain-containing protein n=1 Tax=Actinotalea ferrariae TaxID=1386098 RepID=UPI001C8B2080